MRGQLIDPGISAHQPWLDQEDEEEASLRPT
jgi:hypothetical protein